MGTQPMTSPDDIVVVLGTRPEAIKLAGLCRAAGNRARVVHTGQHYDAHLWYDVVDDLAGVSIATSIEIGGRSRGEQIGSGVEQLTRYLHRHPARCIVVQGDTTRPSRARWPPRACRSRSSTSRPGCGATTAPCRRR